MSSSSDVPAASATDITAPPNNEVDEEIISPNVKLLRACEAASGQVVQLPADVLASLLKSHQTLERTLDAESMVSKQQILDLRRGMYVVQRNTGGKFNLPGLPLHIRTLIWECSINQGHIVAIRVDFDSTEDGYVEVTTPNPAELQVCHESRVVALKVLVPMRYSDSLPLVPLNYHHPHDILWCLEDVDYVLKSFDICQKEQLEFQTVACPWVFWRWKYSEGDVTFEHGEFLEWTVSDMGAHNLVLTIGGEDLCSRGDLILIEPNMCVENYSTGPDGMTTVQSKESQLIRHLTRLHDEAHPECKKPLSEHSWDILAALMVNKATAELTESCKFHQDRRAADILANVTPSKMDTWVENSNNWIIPNITVKQISTIEEQNARRRA